MMICQSVCFQYRHSHENILILYSDYQVFSHQLWLWISIAQSCSGSDEHSQVYFHGYNSFNVISLNLKTFELKRQVTCLLLPPPTYTGETGIGKTHHIFSCPQKEEEWAHRRHLPIAILKSNWKYVTVSSYGYFSWLLDLHFWLFVFSSKLCYFLMKVGSICTHVISSLNLLLSYKSLKSQSSLFFFIFFFLLLLSLSI